MLHCENVKLIRLFVVAAIGWLEKLVYEVAEQL
jgi:hypothetical protein